MVSYVRLFQAPLLIVVKKLETTEMFNNDRVSKKVEPTDQMECSLGMKMVGKQDVLNEEAITMRCTHKCYNSVHFKYVWT